MEKNSQPMMSWSLEDAVEVELADSEDFLKVAETLTRIGEPEKNGKVKKLKQVCHILHKKSKYYIIHYKAMYALDGQHNNVFDVEDLAIQNKCARLLSSWGLVKIVSEAKANLTNDVYVTVVPYRSKSEWELIPQYTFGENI